MTYIHLSVNIIKTLVLQLLTVKLWIILLLSVSGTFLVINALLMTCGDALLMDTDFLKLTYQQ